MATYTYPNTSGVIDLTPGVLSGLGITIAAGDTINVNPGTYDSIKATNLNGSVGNVITINFNFGAAFSRLAFTSNNELVDCSFILFKGISVIQYVNAVFHSMYGNTHDISWQNCSFKNFTDQHAIEIGSNGNPKVFAGSKATTYYNFTWDNCIFDGITYGSFICQKDGISLDCEVKHCTFTNVNAPGTAIYPHPINFHGYGWKIHNNNFSKIGFVPVHLACIQYYGYADVYNNIFTSQVGNDVRCFPLNLNLTGGYLTGKNRFWNNISHDKRKYSIFEINTNNQNDKETDGTGYYIYNPNTEVYFNTLVRSVGDDFHAYLVDFYGADGVVRGNLVLAPEIDKPYNPLTNYVVYNQAGTFHTSTVTQSNNFQQESVFPTNFNDVTFTPVVGGNLIDTMPIDIGYITTDFYGNPRKYGAFSDVGAVESQGVVETLKSINIQKNMNISRNVNKALIGTTTVDVKTLSWNPKASTIKFFAQGMIPITVAYQNLQISGIFVNSRKDAVTKLSTLFPDSAGNLADDDGFVTEAPNITRYYGHHTVLSLIHQDAPGGIGLTVQDWLQAQKDAGFNVIWAHPDDYDPSAAYFKTNLLALITAAEAIGGIWIIPGLHTHNDTGATTATIKNKNIITDTWDRAGVLKIDGKQVYMHYNYNADVAAPATFNQINLNNLLLSDEGIHAKDFILVAECQFPYSFDNRVTWQGETTGVNSIKRWSITFFKGVKPGIAPYFTVTDMDKVITDWFNFTQNDGGLAVFGVDMDKQVIIDTNDHKSKIAKRRKLQGGAWGGYSGFYASASFWDFGYSGMADIWNAIINMRVEDRPIGMLGATGNDDIEYSRMSPMIGMTNGLRYIPSTGTFIGTALPTPVLDRRGMTDFLKPWADAFMGNDSKVSFLTNEIFSWYMLHPKTAAFITTIPAGAISAGYNQTQWDSMIYKIGSGAVTGIKAITDVDNIQMAAHLTGPAGTQYYLKINSTLSSIITVGSNAGQAAYFEIAQAGFTGIPTFSIIAADGVTIVKTGNGAQAISASCWPGGWGILAQKH